MIRRVLKLFSVFVVIVFLVLIFSLGHIYKKNELEYGVTFSKKQAEDLELDWQVTYEAILNDLGVKKVRLPAYWDEIESTNDQYNWEDLDWLINKSVENDIDIVLAVGGRLPRWPECHFPDWVEKLDKETKEKEILSYIEKTINRYKDKKNIIAWQVENEPFLTHFGECPKLNRKLLDSEIALVRALDSRPIIVTDSGELSFWVSAAKRADIFGTTMYRHTFSEQLKSYINYPISPGFFRFKKNLTRLFTRPDNWIVIELQAEPWCPIPFQYVTKEERDRTMDIEKFRDTIEFSSQTGFRQFYLWGVEWWYWEKEINNDNQLWEEAKKLFN